MRKSAAYGSDLILAGVLGLTTLALQTYAYLIG